jgi:hypothetical protein
MHLWNDSASHPVNRHDAVRTGPSHSGALAPSMDGVRRVPCIRVERALHRGRTLTHGTVADQGCVHVPAQRWCLPGERPDSRLRAHPQGVHLIHPKVLPIACLRGLFISTFRGDLRKFGVRSCIIIFYAFQDMGSACSTDYNAVTHGMTVHLRIWITIQSPPSCLLHQNLGRNH